MHLQDGTPGWVEAALVLPDRALVKAVNDPAKLSELRRRWAGIGRDASKLWTCFRHADIKISDTLLDWQATKAYWRREFFKAIDRTYLERHAADVRLFEMANEYTDDDMANGLKPEEMLRAFRNTVAAVAVWNDEFRGKAVTAPDGGVGTIPADCRLVIGNVPVGNDIPKSFYELAVTSDSVLGYHPYTRWFQGQRDPGDWEFHSGRWHFNELQYGLQPVYAFTECLPYLNAQWGWRHPQVCQHDVEKLKQALALWLGDVIGTPAYKQGRILGPGAWFTVGGGSEWQWYELEAAQLNELAEIAVQIWTPGDPMDTLPPEKQALVRQHLDAVWRICSGQWWVGKPVPFQLKPPMRVIEFFQASGQPFSPPQTRHVTYVMDVTEVRMDLLRVWDKAEPQLDWYVKAEEVEPLE